MPTTKPKHPGGRPRHVRSPETAHLVELGAANQTPHHELAKLLGIGIHVLRREYRRELETSHIKAKLKMGGRLYNAGMAGNVKAMAHWLGLRGGPEWRPLPLEHRHGGPGGGAIPLATATAKITDEDAMKAYLKLCNDEE